MARLRVLYLLTVSLAIFLIHDPRFVPIVLAVHLAAVPLIRIPPKQLIRIVWNLRFFFLFITLVQALFPPKSHFVAEWLKYEFEQSADSADRPSATVGLIVSLFQVAQIYTMVLVSTIVRTGDKGRGFVKGLRGLFIPASAVEVIDQCLAQFQSAPTRAATLGATEEGARKGRSMSKSERSENDPAKKDAPPHPVRALLRGDVGWIIDRLEGELGDELLHDESSDTAHDVRLLTRITMIFLSLRMLKVTPGTGLTPGFQNVVVVPLLCFAADRTRGRWGATTVGTASGVLSVMLGFGRNGLFILPAHVLPGFLVDLAWRTIAGSGPPTRLACVALGALAGFARFTGMLCVLLLLDNPELLAAIPFFSAGHIFFGAASAAVTFPLLKESHRRVGRSDSNTIHPTDPGS